MSSNSDATGKGEGGAVQEAGQGSIHIESIDIARIMASIPHRYPFLLIDRMENIHLRKLTSEDRHGKISAVGVKNVTINEPFFAGHFPSYPVMPGVLIVEAMAQTAATLVVLSQGPDAEGKIVYFMTIENAKFRKPVGPGDQLRIHVEEIQQRGRIWRFKGEAIVAGQKTAEATFSAMIKD